MMTTVEQIIEVLAKQDNPVSAVKIAMELGLETTSENIIPIRCECLELVEANKLRMHDANGVYFFSLN